MPTPPRSRDRLDDGHMTAELEEEYAKRETIVVSGIPAQNSTARNDVTEFLGHARSLAFEEVKSDSYFGCIQYNCYVTQEICYRGNIPTKFLSWRGLKLTSSCH